MTDPPAWTGAALIFAAIFGPVSGWYATARHRQPLVWTVLGALIGPLALLLLRTAPVGRCPACETPTRGWPVVCETCGWPLVIQLERATEAVPQTLDRRSEGSTPSSAAAGPIPIAVGREARTAGDPPIRRLAPSRPSRVAAIGGRRPISDEGVLATAVYFGGTAGLVVGSRYAIVREEDRLRLMGPIDWAPTTTAFDRPLADITVTAVDDRLIIRCGGWLGVVLAFGGLTGANGADIEIALTLPAVVAPDARPA